MATTEDLTDRLEKDQIAVLKEQFHVFDLDGNGFIDYDELRQGLKRLGYQLSDEGIENLFNLVGSKDQRLNFEQFIAWKRELYIQDMKDRFREIDTDQSGWIGRQEMMAYYDNMEYAYTEEEIDDFLYETDFNEDGKMQIDEFIAGMAASSTGNAFFVLNCEMFLAKLKLEFQAMDANGDGVVTREELREGSTLSPKEIELTFKELDTDGDGQISLQEFIAAAVGIKKENSTIHQRKTRILKRRKKKTTNGGEATRPKTTNPKKKEGERCAAGNGDTAKMLEPKQKEGSVSGSNAAGSGDAPKSKKKAPGSTKSKPNVSAQ